MESLAARFSIYFHGLRAAVTTLRSAPKDLIAFRDRIWRYLMSLSGRIDRLVRRWQNGTLPKPGAPRPGRTRDPDKPRKPPAFILPRGHMWLIRQVPATVAFGSQLGHLLANDAELREFLKAAPQARRLLNPLCGMFGLTLPAPPAVDSVPPLDLAQAQPAAEPESAANPPPLLADDSSRVAPTAPDPPFVFSSP